MKIVDNFLPEEELASIKKVITSENFPWFYTENVSGPSDDTDIYFIHTFYLNHSATSTFFPMLNSVKEKAEVKAFLRARALLYPGKDKLIEHGRHKDYPFPHKTLLLYLNTNDGFTRLHDGECVHSVENRALFFDGSLEHNSTNCTNAKSRMVLTISYF